MRSDEPYSVIGGLRADLAELLIRLVDSDPGSLHSSSLAFLFDARASRDEVEEIWIDRTIFNQVEFSEVLRFKSNSHKPLTIFT